MKFIFLGRNVAFWSKFDISWKKLEHFKSGNIHHSILESFFFLLKKISLCGIELQNRKISEKTRTFCFVCKLNESKHSNIVVWVYLIKKKNRPYFSCYGSRTKEELTHQHSYFFSMVLTGSVWIFFALKFKKLVHKTD